MTTRLTALLLALLASACGGDSPSPTAPTPPPACQANNTGTLILGNRSQRTYTVSLNGATIATLGPGQDTSPQTLAAGVAHAVRFIYSNTTLLACTPSAPILAQCMTTTHTCAN
jgi:hypothetical protein